MAASDTSGPPPGDSKEAVAGHSTSPVAPSSIDTDPSKHLHVVERGTIVADDELAAAGDIAGFDAARMRARAALTTEEEKALLRKVDWRIMTVCSLLFLIKNIDAANISNARIMNRGTPQNIMTQLNMTADEYNLLTVLYYVSERLLSGAQAVSDARGTRLTRGDRSRTLCSRHPPISC